MSNTRALIAGVGMIPFTKPSQRESYDAMGAGATVAALKDAGLDYSDVQQAYVGFVYGDSTSGQQALYQVGLSGIPIFNVNNACATGSAALFLARQAVESGAADVALALGFEQMSPGAISMAFSDRKPIMEKHMGVMNTVQPPESNSPLAAQLFGGAGREYIEKHGTRPETFAKIAEKARRHAANNPLALFRQPLSIDEIMQSAPVFGHLTRLQCCPPTCGAAAAIVVSPAYARKKGLSGLVEIAGQAMTTDPASSFVGNSMIKIIGYDMARSAAQKVYAQTGVGPKDVDVVELHDCFTTNELLTYEALSLADEGEAERFISDGDNTYGGKVVTNPSGGLLSKGHPLGATGLAQCAELTWQLRGTADKRQVEGAKIALQHNLGLGGACVVTMYRAAQ